MGTIERRTHADPAAFKRRVTRWAARIGVQTERVYIQRMRNKWASCSTSGRLYFSTDVLREPSGFQDTVIAHELLHLLIPNHGALFKSFLNAYLPKSRRISARGRIACSRAEREGGI